jgi:glyoxylase-like metal-dependent hydrolase (beta-lactamase superfamily II)
MIVHHLNCISTCPLGGRLMDGRTRSLAERGLLTCHCLLVETSAGLVLVDTGFGLRDVADPRSRISRFFLGLVSPDFREEMTAIRQIQRLGFDLRDVTHIVLSHLDFDHAGGLDDFPHATVHMLQVERDYAFEQKTWMDRQRFRPQQWSTSGNWRVYQASAGEAWNGFSRVQQLDGLPPELLVVPLRGHTFGHAGIAVNTTGEQWLFNAADAYFYHAEMHAKPHCTPGLRMYQWMLEKDRTARFDNQRRLRELALREFAVTVFCSHDVTEFERLAKRAANEPAQRPGHVPAAMQASLSSNGRIA